jgi:hypothetical protein
MIVDALPAQGALAQPGEGSQDRVGKFIASPAMVSLGATVGILAVVLAQLVEVSLLQVGDFVVSVQKLASLVLLPLSLVLMGRLRLPLALLGFGVAMLIVNATGHVARGRLMDPGMLSANVSVVMGLLGALVLYTALVVDREGPMKLARIWLAVALVSVPVTLLQVPGYFPLLTVDEASRALRVTESGFIRGVGFKRDPNFQALVLVVAMAFAFHATRRALYRVVALGALFAGIVATSSRMGLLAGVAVIAAYPILCAGFSTRRFVASLARAAVLVIGLAVGLGGFYAYGPASAREYIDRRVGEAAMALVMDSPEEFAGRRGLDSATERVLIAYGAVRAIRSSLPFGVGAGRTREAMFASVGISKVTHNTYLEYLLIGGVSAVPAFLIYGWVVLGVLRLAGGEVRALGGALALSFALMAALLTITSSDYWVPLSLVLALVHRERMAEHDSSPLQSL